MCSDTTCNTPYCFTCTTSKSLSSRCNSVFPRSCRSRTTPLPCQPRMLDAHQEEALHAHKLPLGSSLNHIVLGEVYSNTTCNIPNCFQDCRLTPQTSTSLFNVFCPIPHTFQETSHKVTHPKIAPSQACLTVEFLWFRLSKIRCIMLI